MKKIIATAILFSSISMTAHAESMLLGDVAKGRKLHDTDCVKCHGSEVYTRKDHRVKSVEGLMGQVNMCNKNLSRSYSDAQLNDLVKYLNDTFYKFE
jgi:mono/diheme cytochrome c family protein